MGLKSDKVQTMNLLEQGATEVAKQYFLSGVSCPSLGSLWAGLVFPSHGRFPGSLYCKTRPAWSRHYQGYVDWPRWHFHLPRHSVKQRWDWTLPWARSAGYVSSDRHLCWKQWLAKGIIMFLWKIGELLGVSSGTYTFGTNQNCPR